MPTPQPGRRSLLTAAVALPVSAAAAPLLTAPAAAAESAGGFNVVYDWRPLTLRPGVKAFPDDVPQARVVRIAGTDFLQMRGGAGCSFTGDAPLGSLPAGLAVPKLTRGVCPRNNVNGVTACRVEADIHGQVIVLGATPTSKITWVQLDSFSSVLA
ncbi:hypothetical protein [Streptosporangium sp. NPDC000396]|uniref:hypothetical protein n=1 Tax=Streptosporangium sp. NPDC000396 TaxID=3366185 RepID=UPI0036C015CE